MALHAVNETSPDGWRPMGRFGFKLITSLLDGRTRDLAMRELAKEQGANWAPLQAGLFGGFVNSLENSAHRVAKLAGELRLYR